MSGSPTVSMMRFVFSNIFLPPFFLYDIFQTRQNLSSSKKKIENGRKYFRHTPVKCNPAHHWAISIVVIVFLIITYSYLGLSFQRLRLYFYSTAYILTERVALHKELEIGFGVQWKGNLAVWGTPHSQYKSKEIIIKRLWQKNGVKLKICRRWFEGRFSSGLARTPRSARLWVFHFSRSVIFLAGAWLRSEATHLSKVKHPP